MSGPRETPSEECPAHESTSDVEHFRLETKDGDVNLLRCPARPSILPVIAAAFAPLIGGLLLFGGPGREQAAWQPSNDVLLRFTDYREQFARTPLDSDASEDRQFGVLRRWAKSFEHAESDVDRQALVLIAGEVAECGEEFGLGLNPFMRENLLLMADAQVKISQSSEAKEVWRQWLHARIARLDPAQSVMHRMMEHFLDRDALELSESPLWKTFVEYCGENYAAYADITADITAENLAAQHAAWSRVLQHSAVGSDKSPLERFAHEYALIYAMQQVKDTQFTGLPADTQGRIQMQLTQMLVRYAATQPHIEFEVLRSLRHDGPIPLSGFLPSALLKIQAHYGKDHPLYWEAERILARNSWGTKT